MEVLFALYRHHWPHDNTQPATGSNEGQEGTREEGNQGTRQQEDQNPNQEADDENDSESPEIYIDSVGWGVTEKDFEDMESGDLQANLELAHALGVPAERIERLTPKKPKPDPEQLPQPKVPTKDVDTTKDTLVPEPDSCSRPGQEPSSSVDREQWRAQRIAELR